MTTNISYSQLTPIDIELELDVYCSCGESVSISAYVRSNSGGPRVMMTVNPCESCLLSAQREVEVIKDKLEGFYEEKD